MISLRSLRAAIDEALDDALHAHEARALHEHCRVGRDERIECRTQRVELAKVSAAATEGLRGRGR
jgi:hypothetical protein